MSSINAAAITAKHKGNAEGSVRVLGQTAAVAGISGALLLALKAMVLVSPAVLPGGDGLDALGRPNAVAPVVEPAPVVFEPASADMPIGSSERTAPSVTRTVVIPTKTTTTTGPVTTTKPNTPATPSNPANPSTPVNTGGGLTQTTKPVTDLLDGVVPGVGSTVSGLTKTLDNTVNSLPVVGPTLGGVTGTVGGLVDNTVTPLVGGVTGGSGNGGLLSGVTGEDGLLGGVTGSLLGGSSSSTEAPKKKLLGLL